MPDQELTARRLLNHQSFGVLSTHSADVEGYPFGSIAPYVLDYDGEPAILISEIAQHTRNIKQNNKVSLTVFDPQTEDPQASSRLTWIGDAESIDPSETEIRHRYLRYFPSAESYFETHDFSFYRIRLRRARFIGGFGQIFWIEPTSMLVTNPFRETERGIVEHMNRDHQKALFHYCKILEGVEADGVTMTGIDSEGFDMLADKRKLRIDFDSPIHTSEEARANLVRLARLDHPDARG
jgi:heme oxygenase (biliverdin-IX-beta and delta-forming)